MSEMDVLCLATPNKKIYNYGIASLKLVDYLIVEKPIIHFSSKSHNFISKSNLGFGIHTENSLNKRTKKLDEIIKKLETLDFDFKLEQKKYLDSQLINDYHLKKIINTILD